MHARPEWINPSNAEDTLVQSTRTLSFFENHLNPVLLIFIGELLLKQVLSDKYPYARLSIIFRVFASFCIGQISHQQHMC